MIVFFIPWQANAKMLAELESLKASQTPGSSSTTPPATRRAPTPASKQKARPRQEPEPETGDRDDGSDGASDGNEDLSEAAKRNRLRRLCEKKPSGKRNVPEEIGLKWEKQGRDRDELLEALEASNYDKDQVLTMLIIADEVI